MENKQFDTGMYIIDKDYRILNYNSVLKDMYPRTQLGDFCYHALALSDTPCATCPLRSNGAALFYNSLRKEWIKASAATIDYPGHGECYNIQFRCKKSNGVKKTELLPLSDLSGSEALIGAYWESGSPICFANKPMVDLLGYDSLDEMISAIDGLVVNTVHPEDRARVKLDMSNATSEGDEYETTYRMPRKDGSWVWTATKGKVFATASGRLFTLSACTEMGRLLRHNEALKVENKKLTTREQHSKAFLHSIPGGYHRCANEEGYPFLYISDSFEEVVGWTREEIRQEFDNKFINLILPEDLPLFAGLENAIADHGQGSVIYRIKKKGGGFRWVQDSTMIVELESGSYYQCTLADITAFVNKQDELARQNMELAQKEYFSKAMVQNMPSGYHRCKAEEGCPFIYIGNHFEDIVGFTKEEIQTQFGNLFRNLVWEEDLSIMRTYSDMLAMRGKGNAYDTSVYRMKHKDGSYRWVTDSTMFVDLGADSFFQSTIADITEYIENLNAARKHAEASSLAKSTFLFNASHDIRTPMNAIQGFAHIIEQNADNADIVRNTISKVQQSSDTLMTLLNDVLELARIERGKESVHFQPLNMEAHAVKLYEMFCGEMTKAGIRFIMENDIRHPEVLGDDLKLTRVAMNLLSNAKKFTPMGGTVVFGIREQDSTDDSASYCLFVRDTGIGMSKEFQARAFEQFERERTSTDSGIVGSGLGLAIIKKLVDLMGGECKIESELGQGTQITVLVTLPLNIQPNSADTVIAAPETVFAGKRVLLVEDNQFNREIARYILTGMQFMVDEASNGAECINMLTQAESGHYDLILMDIQMPIMDGYTAAKAIRSIADPRLSAIPILAMTANAFDEDRKKCLDVGMNGHISKPIHPETLTQTLLNTLSL